MDSTLLTPSQIAERLRTTERTLYNWLRSGHLSGMKVGRLWRIPEENLAAFLQSNGHDKFDEPLTSEEAADSEAAWAAYVRGEDPGEPLEVVREELMSARRG
jgi:excisionase family DNA binding protein